MQINLVWELIKKDWAEAMKSKQVLLSILLLPTLLGIALPIIMMLTTVMVPGDSFDAELGFFLNILPKMTPDWEILSDQAKGLILMSIFSQIFLLMIPIMVGTLISTDAVIGERERQTIEGLFALPMTDSEILLAKILSSLIPLIGFSWILSGFFAIIVDLISFPFVQRLLLPDIRFILLVLFFSPLIGLAAIVFTVMISSRVSTQRDAQQLTGLFVLPALLFIVGQLIIIIINVWFILIGIIVLSIFDYIAFKISISIFSREKLMTLT